MDVPLFISQSPPAEYQILTFLIANFNSCSWNPEYLSLVTNFVVCRSTSGSDPSIFWLPIFKLGTFPYYRLGTSQCSQPWMGSTISWHIRHGTWSRRICCGQQMIYNDWPSNTPTRPKWWTCLYSKWYPHLRPFILLPFKKLPFTKHNNSCFDCLLLTLFTPRFITSFRNCNRSC